MKPNKLREKLNKSQPTLSTHIHSTWMPAVEALGYTEIYDYVEFVAEYGTFDLHDLDNICRTAELYNMGSMIKVDQSHQVFLAQRGIGAGFNSVLFTDCRTVEDVKECVRIVRPDTPHDGGLYGVATRRNTYMGYGGSPDYVQSLRDVVVAIMIEKRTAVSNLEEILSVPGIDMIQWGGSDYSMSIGKPGERNHPDVIRARNKVFGTALKFGIQPRAEINSPNEADTYLEMGVRHFSLGTDINILHDWWKGNGEQLRGLLSTAD